MNSFVVLDDVRYLNVDRKREEETIKRMGLETRTLDTLVMLMKGVEKYLHIK